MKKSSLNLILMAAIIMGIAGCQSQKSESEMVEFGKEYTSAWNSKKPENVSSFYAKDGSLTVNNGAPATGTDELIKLVNSYMEAFPDMKLSMDSLVEDSGSYRYHWTFTGTNIGPGGTGNKVIFSGVERWTMNGEGLVQKSIGTYDAEDYSRQLNGIKN